jgi:Family of unknown function (DUF6082)
MAPAPCNDHNHERAGSGRAAAGAVQVAGLACLSLASGVGVLALLSVVITDEQWNSWAKIGDAFGAPAVVVAVAVAVITYSRGQRQQTRNALRRSHINLIMAALNDPDLAEVWPSRGEHLSPRQRKQHLYADQILQDIFAHMASGEHSATQTRRALERAFQSPIVRDAWWAVAPARAKVVEPGTAECAFFQLANEAYVLAEAATDPQETSGLEYRP